MTDKDTRLENNYKLAMWKFYKQDMMPPELTHYRDARDNWVQAPNFTTSDEEAARLLSVLKERGYWFMLGTETDELDMLTGEYRFKIVPPQGKTVNVYANTIAGAISSAILQLIADKT